jgi:chromosome segregation ATPase
LPDYEEAYRNAHNFLAAYESIGTLKQVLGTLMDAQRQLDAIRASTAQTQAQQAHALEELRKLQHEQQGLAEELAKARAHAKIVHEAALEGYRQETAALEAPLHKARADLKAAQVEAATVKERVTAEAQRVAAVVRGQAQQEADQVRQEVVALRKEVATLTETKARMLADLRGAVERVDLARGA